MRAGAYGEITYSRSRELDRQRKPKIRTLKEIKKSELRQE